MSWKAWVRRREEVRLDREATIESDSPTREADLESLNKYIQWLNGKEQQARMVLVANGKS